MSPMSSMQVIEFGESMKSPDPREMNFVNMFVGFGTGEINCRGRTMSNREYPLDMRISSAFALVHAYHDDGVGFEAAEDFVDSTHVGLSIMKERAMKIGAHLEVEANKPNGAKISLTLPA